ncbi:MAG: hypothetical protein DCC67_08840 [Planctomycetota bacterium]|nr:MAG: hypothetical protein DCC67_08840 [Planctomycetota bacterium]
MKDDVHPPTPTAAPQFRLRTLLGVTTALAVLAALAGPLYRSAPPEGQTRLLMHWSALLSVTGLAYFSHQRENSRRHGGRPARFVVWETSRNRAAERRLWLGVWLWLILVWICITSYAAAFEQHSAWEALGSSLIPGIAAAGLIASYSRRVLFLCDEGIPLAKRDFVQWHYIGAAEAVKWRSNVMRLRRRYGDIYIEVPAELYAAVETFLSEKGVKVAPSASRA